MRYTLLLHWPEPEEGFLTEEVATAGRAAMGAYAATLHAAGVLVAAEVLRPSASSTSLRLAADGSPRIEDGAFADTAEQLGGTVVVDVEDLDAALAWAREAPPLHWGGGVEIRPGATHVVDGVWVPNA